MLCASSECKFCDVSVDKNFNIVYEDKEFIAFHDIDPAARLHLLLIPRRHIKSVKVLTNLDLVQRMEEIGANLARDTSIISVGHKDMKQDGDRPMAIRLGFHVPPFYSVPHLHLHVLRGPFKNSRRSIKYSEKPVAVWFRALRAAMADVGQPS